MSQSPTSQTGANAAQPSSQNSYSSSTQGDLHRTGEQEDALVHELVSAIENIAESPEDHELIKDGEDGYWFNLEDVVTRFEDSYIDMNELDPQELDDQMWALGYALEEIDQRDQITLSVHDYSTEFGKSYHDFRRHKKDAEAFGGVNIPHYRVE